MTLLDEAAVDAASAPSSRRPNALALVLALAAVFVRSVLAAASGVVLTAGIALLVWALTPDSGSSPSAAVAAGAALFAAAHGMSAQLGTLTLTLPPLLFTLIGVALLGAAVRRGRFLPTSRGQEAAVAAMAAIGYGLVVALSPGWLSASVLVPADQWWRPVLLALIVAGVASFTRDGLPALSSAWLTTSLRLGVTGAAVLAGAGALALAVGLGASFSTASRIAESAAPGTADGVGLLLLGVAFLPNAVVAGAGYITGLGFSVGGGTYSPLATHVVDLPALPLLAATPQHPGVNATGLVFLAGPVLAGVLIGRGAVRRLSYRADRLRAVLGASALAGVIMGALALLAAGGVTPGAWAVTGVAAGPFAVVVAAELAVGSVAVAMVARAVPPPSPATPTHRRSAVANPAPSRPADVEDVEDVEDAEVAEDAEDETAMEPVAHAPDDEDPGGDASGAQGLDGDELGGDGPAGEGDPEDGASPDDELGPSAESDSEAGSTAESSQPRRRSADSRSRKGTRGRRR